MDHHRRARGTLRVGRASFDEIDAKLARKFTDGEPAFVAGRTGQAADFDGRRFVDAGKIGSFGFLDKFCLSAWVNPTDAAGGMIVSRMKDARKRPVTTS